QRGLNADLQPVELYPGLVDGAIVVGIVNFGQTQAQLAVVVIFASAVERGPDVSAEQTRSGFRHQHQVCHGKGTEADLFCLRTDVLLEVVRHRQTRTEVGHGDPLPNHADIDVRELLEHVTHHDAAGEGANS